MAEHQARRLAGEGLLFVTLDGHGKVAGYSDITVWPERASAELAGAIRADLQNQGQGGRGMSRSFDWIFETLGVRLMCLTAALDNVRSQKGIDAAGFRRMGEREVVRADGTRRASVYWEIAIRNVLGGKDGDAVSLDAVNRRGKPVRVALRFAPLASNGNEVRGAIVMMEASDG